jgi:uncharacterized protein
MADVSFLWHHIYSRTTELLPWFLLALVLAGLLEHMRIDMLAKGSLRRRSVAAAGASALTGALSPFCACSIVPLVRGFLAAGVPVSVVMAFWISSPAMAPEIFGLTASAFGIKIAVARLVGAIVLAMGAFAVARVMENRGLLDNPLRDPVSAAPDAKAVAASRLPVASGSQGSSQVAEAAQPVLLEMLAQRPQGGVATLSPPLLLLDAGSGGDCCGSSGTLAPPDSGGEEQASCCSPGELDTVGPMLPGSGSLSLTLLGDSDSGGDCCGSTKTMAPASSSVREQASCCAPDQVIAIDQESEIPWHEAAKQSLQQASLWDFGSGLLRNCWLMGRWMLLGILIEALVTLYVSPHAFDAILDRNVVISVLVGALLSIPLYLTGVSAIPIGLSLVAVGMSQAGLTTFMLAGAITTIPAMAAVRAVVNRRIFLLYITTGVVGSILVGLAAAPFVG